MDVKDFKEKEWFIPYEEIWNKCWQLEYVDMYLWLDQRSKKKRHSMTSHWVPIELLEEYIKEVWCKNINDKSNDI